MVLGCSLKYTKQIVLEMLLLKLYIASYSTTLFSESTRAFHSRHQATILVFLILQASVITINLM